MLKIYKRIVSSWVVLGLLILFVFILPLATWVVLAAMNPSFTVQLSSSRTRANPDITWIITEPSDTKFGKTKVFRVPAGWDIAGGNSLAQDELIGTGTFSGWVYGGKRNVAVLVNIYNDLDLQGHKAHWKFSVLNRLLVVDAFVDGDVSKGHTFTLIAPDYLHLSPPATFTFTLTGKIKGTNLLTNPASSGNNTWEIDFISADNERITKSQAVNIP